MSVYQVIDRNAVSALVAPGTMRSNMDARFLSAFVQGAAEVLGSEIGGNIERGAVTLQRSSYTANDVNVMLTVVGRLRGVVVFGMPQFTALGIISHIMGQRLDDMDELAQSGIAELGNVITGRASTLLAGMGYATQLSVPTLIIGKAMISVLDFHRVVVPLNCQYGSLEVHLALRETSETLASVAV